MSSRTIRSILFLSVLAATTVACSSGDEAIDSTEAAAVVTDIADAVEIDQFADLDRCPQDPGGVLLAEATAELESHDLDRARAAELEAGVFEAGASLARIVICDRFDDGSSTGLVVTTAPDQVDDYIESIALGEDGESGATIERLGAVDHRGGTLHRVCVEGPADDDDDLVDYCEAIWMDDILLVGVYVSGPSSLDTDLDTLEAGLTAILDRVVSNLAATEAGAVTG